MLAAENHPQTWRSHIGLPVHRFFRRPGHGPGGLGRLEIRPPRPAAGTPAPVVIGHESFVTSMKAVGELSVFRIMTKEVITASDHWFGEFGKKYLNWLLSEQRITLVIEFDVDFRYDLNDPAVPGRAPGSRRASRSSCRPAGTRS